MQVHVSWWYSFMSSCNIHSKVTLLMFTSKIWKYKCHLPWYKMWNTLKHRNDYICTILINPILIKINQFFHPEIIFDKYCSLFEIISDEYCSSFINKFYSDYFIMFLLFYFIFQKSCTFLKIFFMCIIVNQICTTYWYLYTKYEYTCTSVFDVVDFKQVLYYAIGKHVHVWYLFFITWRRLQMKQKFIDLFLVLVNQFSFIQTWYISMPLFHRSMYTF